MQGRHEQLASEAVRYLSGASGRPRAVLVSGAAGIGKSRLLDQIQVAALDAGVTVHVVDDAHEMSTQQIDALEALLAADARERCIIAGREFPDALLTLVERRCERRIIEVPELDADAARELLVQLGIAPFAFFAAQAIDASAGNPRELIDAAIGSIDVHALPVDDASFDAVAWSAGAAERVRLVQSNDQDGLAALIERCTAIVDDAAADLADRADAAMVLAAQSLKSFDLEAAIQYGERGAADAAAPEAVRLLSSAQASTARAFLGEPTAMLSLHALAGRAARAGEQLVEAEIWHLIGWCSANLGDVQTARRAFVRSIQLCDASDAVVCGMMSRLALGDLHLAANEHATAVAYYRELIEIAEHRELHIMRLDALVCEGRGLLAGGNADAACERADQALELVLQLGAARINTVEVAVVAARAYAATGSTSLALAPLMSLTSELGDSSSPDFWLVLEAVRVLASSDAPTELPAWLELMAGFDADGHGGALRAAHAEVDAWRAHVDGRRAEAKRLAERARQLWIDAECHDELPLTEQLVQEPAVEHGPGVSILGNAAAPAADPEAFDVLTKREREIARYVAGGLTNPEIASELHLSPRTVEHHVASILRKLELPSRRELVRGRV